MKKIYLISLAAFSISGYANDFTQCPSPEQFNDYINSHNVGEEVSLPVNYGNGYLNWEFEKRAITTELKENAQSNKYHFAWASVERTPLTLPSFQKYQYHVACAYYPEESNSPVGADLVVLTQYSPVDNQLTFATSLDDRWSDRALSYCGNFNSLEKYDVNACKFKANI